MALPRYKKCCMCTDVRTGAIILAMIGILGAGFSVISDSVGLGYYAPMIEDRIEEEKIASMAKFQVHFSHNGKIFVVKLITNHNSFCTVVLAE